MSNTSVLIVKIESIDESTIKYTSITDFHQRDYRHIIPNTSNFPFNRVQIGKKYCLVSVKVNNIWHWYTAWDLSQIVVLKDTTLNITI